MWGQRETNFLKRILVGTIYVYQEKLNQKDSSNIWIFIDKTEALLFTEFCLLVQQAREVPLA